MDRKKIPVTRNKRSSAISPIIATLLLILIAIAAGVVVYAYVIGFVGNSTQNSGQNTSIISIDNFCASHGNTTCGGSAFSLTVRNEGTTTISFSTNAPSLYISDVTSGIVPVGATPSCTPSSVAPSQTYTCTIATWNKVAEPSAGDTISVKIVNPDGGQASASIKALS